MENKLYLVVITCQKDDESFEKGNTIKAFSNEAEAFAYYQGLVDGIWGNVDDDDIDYLGRDYDTCMKERLFVSTDWLEIGMTEIKNGSHILL